MKVLSIILCTLTIIMLIALSITIIKNNDENISNKEKKYMLLFITSFILLMISSILSTLGNNILAIIVFILFIVVIVLASITYFTHKKKINSQKKQTVPKKLEDNLLVLKESNDGYIYKVTTKLTCCNDNLFSIKYRKDKDITILKCKCTECDKEYEVFNSEIDGYKLSDDNEVKIIKTKYKEQQCKKCESDTYEVEIIYDYLENDNETIKELKDLGIKDLTNIYTKIKVNLLCKKCNKKEKGFINYESN